MHCYQVAPLAQKKSYWSILDVTNKSPPNHIPKFFFIWRGVFHITFSVESNKSHGFTKHYNWCVRLVFFVKKKWRRRRMLANVVLAAVDLKYNIYNIHIAKYIDGVQFLFHSDPSHQVFRRQRNALWGAGWRRSQDGSERQAEDRACAGKALNEVSDWTPIVAACSQVCCRAVEVVYGLSTFTNSSRITKPLRIKSRMNSDEKEDCECAPPQAETSAAGGTYR